MKLVTCFEAATVSTAQLRGLLNVAFAASAAAPPGSQERCDALASMCNIEIELARRSPSL